MRRLIFNRIVDDLSKTEFFNSFRFRKRDSTFISSNREGWTSVSLNHWIDKYSGNLLVIYPIYGVKFYVLSKWFENFSFKSIKDQRDNYNIGFVGTMINHSIDKFVFELNGYGFEDDLKLLRNEIIECANYVFNEYSTLPKLYEKIIEPILLGETELPDVGADWIFEDLTLCRIINPDNYDKLKVIIRAHIEWMYSRKEPNIISYYNRLDEIFSYLESINF